MLFPSSNCHFYKKFKQQSLFYKFYHLSYKILNVIFFCCCLHILTNIILFNLFRASFTRYLFSKMKDDNRIFSFIKKDHMISS